MLILRDGEVFEGEAIGALDAGSVATGEVVFNTALSGYQEIVTDPSYAGQIITFTYPHIGNYGTNPDDDESRRPFCRGVVVRDLARRPSSWRSTEPFPDFLVRHGVPGIAGIDTRRLTRHLRDTGAVPGAFGTDEALVRAAAEEAVATDGIDLAATVTTDAGYTVGDPDAPFHVDRLRPRHQAHDPAPPQGGRLLRRGRPGRRPRPPTCSAGTPTASSCRTAPVTRPRSHRRSKRSAGCVGTGVPLFGICLGHQILGLALGGRTVKLPFGHHGANHPVRHEPTGRVEITSQNHNYAVDADALGGDVEITHVNLNDGVCEGLTVRGEPVFSVQHHPEAGPGPHDAAYLFEEFTALMAESR